MMMNLVLALVAVAGVVLLVVTRRKRAAGGASGDTAKAAKGAAVPKVKAPKVPKLPKLKAGKEPKEPKPGKAPKARKQKAAKEVTADTPRAGRRFGLRRAAAPVATVAPDEPTLADEAAVAPADAVAIGVGTEQAGPDVLPFAAGTEDEPDWDTMRAEMMGLAPDAGEPETVSAETTTPSAGPEPLEPLADAAPAWEDEELITDPGWPLPGDPDAAWNGEPVASPPVNLGDPAPEAVGGMLIGREPEPEGDAAPEDDQPTASLAWSQPDPQTDWFAANDEAPDAAEAAAPDADAAPVADAPVIGFSDFTSLGGTLGDEAPPAPPAPVEFAPPAEAPVLEFAAAEPEFASAGEFAATSELAPEPVVEPFAAVDFAPPAVEPAPDFAPVSPEFAPAAEFAATLEVAPELAADPFATVEFAPPVPDETQEAAPSAEPMFSPAPITTPDVAPPTFALDVPPVAVDVAAEAEPAAEVAWGWEAPADVAEVAPDASGPATDAVDALPTDDALTGRFAIGGMALEAGHEALARVAFRTPLDGDAPVVWGHRDEVDAAPGTIVIQVEAVMNCDASQLAVMFEPGFAPTSDGFTVRLASAARGPFAASGTFWVVPAAVE